MKLKTFSKILLPTALSMLLALPVHAEVVKLGRNANATEQAVAQLIVEDIYSRAGMTAEVQPMPAARANAAALAGKKDGEVGRIQGYFNNNPSLVQVTPAYYYITTTGFAKDGSDISISSREDLEGYTVGVIRGVAHTHAATEGHADTRVVSDADQLYKMLAAGRIDIALDAGINGPYMLNKLGINGVSAIGDLARLDLFFVLHPDHASLAPRLSSVVKSLNDSGEMQKLVERYEGEFLASGAPN